MNWPLLLSTYPRPLLGNSLPLVLLALLERSGLVTENKLLEQAGAAEADTKNALFDLRLSNLIEYGSHYVRITDRGRILLNRFNLDQDVVSEILDLLALSSEERESYRFALGTYRENAYTSYLNSLGSVHALMDLCRDVPAERTLDREKLAIGRKVLLTRDLVYWWRAKEAKAPLAGGEPEYHCKILALRFDGWKAGINEAYPEWSFTNALLRGAKEDSLSERFTPTPKSGLEERLWTYFDLFRRSSEPNIWFDRLEDVKSNWFRSKNSLENLTTYLAELSTSMRALSADEWPMYTVANLHVHMPWLHAIDGGSVGASGLLEGIRIATRLTEFVGLSGLSREEAQAFLRETADKCQALLDSDKESD